MAGRLPASHRGSAWLLASTGCTGRCGSSRSSTGGVERGYAGRLWAANYSQRVELLFWGGFQLSPGVLQSGTDEVEGGVAGVKRHVVPGRNNAALPVEQAAAMEKGPGSTELDSTPRVQLLPYLRRTPGREVRRPVPPPPLARAPPVAVAARRYPRLSSSLRGPRRSCLIHPVPAAPAARPPPLPQHSSPRIESQALATVAARALTPMLDGRTSPGVRPEGKSMWGRGALLTPCCTRKVDARNRPELIRTQCQAMAHGANPNQGAQLSYLLQLSYLFCASVRSRALNSYLLHMQATVDSSDPPSSV